MGFLLLITYGPIMQYVDLKLNTSNFYMQGKQKTCRYLFLNEFIDPIRFRWKREGNIISRVANM